MSKDVILNLERLCQTSIDMASHFIADKKLGLQNQQEKASKSSNKQKSFLQN